MSHPSYESPFLLIIGWNEAEYSERGRQTLVTLVTHLRDESGLRGCLAAVPADPHARQWLFSFLGSVKRGMSATAGAMVRASAICSADLTASSASGLDELIIIQDTGDPAPAIETVRGFQQSGTASTLGIRVWLDVPGASFQSLTCAWKYGTHAPLRVELPPFRQVSSNGFSTNPRKDGQQLACEWLRTTITVSSHGVIVPCPAYLSHCVSESGPAEKPPTDIALHLVQSRSAWMVAGGSHPVCASCSRLVRFAGPGDAEIPAQACARTMPAPVFVDHIGMDASGLSAGDRAEAMRAFLERVHVAGGLRPL